MDYGKYIQIHAVHTDILLFSNLFVFKLSIINSYALD